MISPSGCVPRAEGSAHNGTAHGWLCAAGPLRRRSGTPTCNKTLSRSGTSERADHQDHKQRRPPTPSTGVTDPPTDREGIGEGATSPQSARAALTRRPTPADPSQTLSVALRGQR